MPMCGIIGYVGRRAVLPILLEGLKRLEDRGYDSAGVYVVNDGLFMLKTFGCSSQSCPWCRFSFLPIALRWKDCDFDKLRNLQTA